MKPQIHCKVFRTTTDYAFNDEGDREHVITNSWWAKCKYEWGTIETVHPTWKNAMVHVNDEIDRVTEMVERKWNR